jgi:hypothetical protein
VIRLGVAFSVRDQVEIRADRDKVRWWAVK